MKKTSLFLIFAGILLLIAGIYSVSALQEISTITLNSTSGTNYSDENLTAWISPLNSSQKYIYDWRKNNASLAILNVPLDGGENCGTNYTCNFGDSGDNVKIGYSVDSHKPTYDSTGGFDGNGAYIFDGVDDVMHTGTESLYNFERTEKFSLEAYVKSTDSGGHNPIFSNLLNDATYRGYELSITSSGAIEIKLINDWDNSNYLSATTVDTGFYDGDFHHVFVSYDGNSDVSGVNIYVDGSLTTTNDVNTLSGTITGTGYGVHIGNRPFSTSFNGTIDEIRIWDRNVSAEQILELYNNRTDLIVSQETVIGENWSVEVTPVYGGESGVGVLSNNLTISDKEPPYEITIYNISNKEESVFGEEDLNVSFIVKDSDEATLSCELYVDDVKGFGINQSVSNGTITLLQINQSLDTGDYNLSISCSDGSLSNSSSNFSFEIDKSPPTFNNLTNQIAELGLAFSYGVNATDSNDVSCFSVNDTVNFTINCTGALTNNTVLSMGTYSLNITVNDTLGNENSSILIISVQDSGSPQVSLILNDTTTLEFYQDSLEIIWNSTDLTLATTIFNVTFPNGSLLFESTDANGVVVLTTDNLTSLGNYNISLFTNDSSGNSNLTSTSFVVEDTTNPVLTAVSPEAKTYLVNYTDFNVSINENASSCDFSFDGGANTSMTRFNSTYFNYTNYTEITEGTHNVTFYCSDFTGNSGSVDVSFGVDIVPPAISLEYPVTHEYISSSTVVFNYTPSVLGGLGSLDSCVLYGNFDGSWAINQTENSPANDTTNNFSLTLQDRDYLWNVWCNETLTSNFDFSAQGNQTFSIDTTPPTFSSIQNQTINEGVALNYDIDAIDATTSINCFSVDDITNFSITCAGVLTNASDLEDGNYSLNITVNDTLGNEASSFLLIEILYIDLDSDGVDDEDDTLIGGIDDLNQEGYSDINVNLNGSTNLSGSFTGVQGLIIYEGADVIINTTHNFSEGKIYFNKIHVAKGTNYVLANFSGQLLAGETKIMYINDNDFIGLCIKNEEIGDISEISSGCDGANEYDFTGCIGNSTGYSNGTITCYDEGSKIKIENLTHSGVLGIVAASTPSEDTSNSGRGSSSCTYDVNYNWDCSSWDECIDGKQIRICKEKNNCGNIWERPDVEKSCIIQENDEEEIKQNDSKNVSGSDNQNIEKSINWSYWIIGLVVIVIILILIFKLIKIYNKKHRYDWTNRGRILSGNHYHQTGNTINRMRDRAYRALKPGKRKSKHGKTYYEYRKNRSDIGGKDSTIKGN